MNIFLRTLRYLFGVVVLLALAVPVSGTESNYTPSLWVAADQALVRLSADDGTLLDEIDQTGPPPYAAAESATDGELWVLFHHQLDAWSAEGAPLVSVSLPQDVHVSALHTALAVDTAGGVVWLMGNNTLYRFDMQGNLLGSVETAHWIAGISFDPKHSQLWVAAGNQLTAYAADGSVMGSFALAGHGLIRALAYSDMLSSLWVIRGDDLYRYTVSDGMIATQIDLPYYADRFLAADGSGAVWAGGYGSLSRVDGSGLVEFTLSNLSDPLSIFVGLVANSSDHSVWLATRPLFWFLGLGKLIHVGADSTVLQTIHLDDHPGYGGAVDALALYAAAAPPTLTFTAPASAAFVATKRPELDFHYSDPGPGVDLTTLALLANGAPVSVNCTSASGSTPTAGTATCALAADLDEGGQSLSATVADFAGNTSKSATLSFTVDTIPPTITITQPGGRYTNQPHLILQGHLSEAGTLTVNGTTVSVGTDLGFSMALNLAEGDNLITLVATDLAGNTSALTRTVTLDTVAPDAPNLGLIGVSDPTGGNLTVTGTSGAVDPGVAVTVTDVTTGASVIVYADQNGGFTATLPGAHGDLIAITLTDEAGNTTPGAHDLAAGTLPPAPASVAPVLTPTGITPFGDATAFLYSGANPIQIGVAAGTITPERAAVIRGRVLDPNGNPLPGATVTILHHPEFGQTQSRLDGRFDLGVNGGGSLAVVYQRKGYTEVERTVPISWNDYAWAPDVVLRPLAAPAGTVGFGAAAPEQFITGPTTTDDAGTRQPAVFFPAGTTATMKLPDGSTAPLAEGTLRITEYTVGQRGPNAMPAKLPTYSAYTYAADFSFDEAAAQNASTVQFSQTVYAYLTNFLQAPVGITVPSGSYDFDNARWNASGNGLVIKILGVDAQGAAEVDVDGTGQAADPATLAQLGFTSAELVSLATHYPVGAEIWRMPIQHFTPFDWNWWGIQQDLNVIPDVAPHVNKLPRCKDACCHVHGCIVRVMTRELGENLPVVGTPYSLYYSSRRAAGGRLALSRLEIPLTGPYDAQHFETLEKVRLEVDIAGEHFVKYFPPDPNQTYTYAWDGLDGYGRPVTGSANATITVSLISDIRYVAIHDKGTAWNMPVWTGGEQIFATRTDQTETASKRFPPVALFAPLKSVQGAVASGWDLDAHAFYDASAGILYHGDGTTRSVQDMPLQSKELATNLLMDAPIEVYIGGSVTTLTNASAIVSVDSDGDQTEIANVPAGDDVVDLRDTGLALYALDAAHGQIDAVQGGTLLPYISGLVQPRAFVAEPGGGFLVAACGAIFSAQFFSATPPERVAGQGCDAEGDNGDGGSAFQGKIDPTAIGIASDGSVFFIQKDEVNGIPSDRVREIARDGTLSTIAGGGTIAASGIQAPVAATSAAFQRLTSLMVRPDGGLVLTSPNGFYFLDDGTLEPPKSLGQGIVAAHVDPGVNGDFVVSTTSGQLLVLAPSLPTGFANGYTIAATDGRTVDAFDAYGRETGVYDTIMGNKLLSFQYDSVGRLTGLTDVYGRTTSIQRGPGGHAEAIVSPDGQTTALTVDGNGNLDAIADPAGDAWQMAYGTSSLLTQFTDPDGRADHYSYDPFGYLSQVQEPNGGGWTINGSVVGPQGSPEDTFYGTLTSGEGRVTTYNNDAGKWFCLYPGWQDTCGYTSATIQHPDGTETRSVSLNATWDQSAEFATTQSDGTHTITTSGPGLRFGFESPLSGSSVTLPSNKSSNFSEVRTAIDVPGNPLAVSSFTDEVYIDNANEGYTSHYDAENHTWTMTTPMGRTFTAIVDALDRPVAVMAPELATVAYAYDAAGRITGITAGSGDIMRSVGFQYYANGPAKGWLQTVTDPLGRTTSYGYDPAGRVTAETLPDGEVIGFGYDAAGNLTSVSPPSRPAHGMGYTAVNQLASYSPPATSSGAGSVGYSYNLDRQLTGIALPSGKSVGLHYNSVGQLASMNVPSAQYQYGYDATTGHLATIAGGTDNETLAFSYDGFLPTQTTWTGPVPGTVVADYGSNNIFRIDALTINGKSVTYGYEGYAGEDNNGLLTRVGTLHLTRDADSGFITSASLAATAGSAEKTTTVFSYDRFGEIAEQQLTGKAEQLDLTLNVSPVTATAPALNIEGTLPGAAELEICVNDLTPCNDFSVAADGSVSGSLSLTQASNTLGIKVYNATGNLIGQGQTSVAYQPAAAPYSVYSLNAVGADGTLYFAGSVGGGPQSQFVLAAGAASANAPAGLQAAQMLASAPDGSVYYVDVNNMLWHWTPGGTLVSLADLSNYYPSTLAAGPDGNVYFTQFNSESLYRVDPSGVVGTAATLGDCTGTAPSQPSQAAEANGLSGIHPNIIAEGYNLTVAASAAGVFVGCENTAQTAYVVHKLAADGTVTVQATSPLSAPQFAAGPDGSICFAQGGDTSIACIAPAGGETDYPLAGGLDSFGLDSSGTLYYSAYDSNGNLLLWRWTAGGSVSLLPSAPSEPATLSVTGTVTASSGATYDAQYTRNKAGQISFKTETINGTAASWAYGYDPNGRLASVTQSAMMTQYGYDPNGNRVSMNGATVATYNARDQLLTYDQNSYTWTADGGLATKTTPSGITHYTWNALGELTDVTLPDGTAIHYIYDGIGRRIGKEKNGTLMAGYLYAGGQIVAETDGSGNMLERFVYATRANVPDYFIKYNADGTTGTYQIVSDQVGSVREVINVSTGVAVQRIDYDVWGNITTDTDPGFQPFTFAGGLYDADTGLVHFGARDYDPETARWISRDPILFAGGDPNLYRYVVDDPVNMTDMLGLSGFGGFVSTFTNGNPSLATPQGAATMAAVGQAQQIAQAAQAAAIQCISSQFQKNFNYYSSAIPNAVRDEDPFRSIGGLAKDATRYAGIYDLKAYALVRSQGAMASSDLAGARAFGRGAAGVGAVGETFEFGTAIYAGLDIGIGIDAVGATLTGLGNCPCDGGQ
ncbi:MAG: RHS repeat-associated core domain-containing protein [Gammaproteobacteria bacterium]